jgi:hypothetical protein
MTSCSLKQLGGGLTDTPWIVPGDQISHVGSYSLLNFVPAIRLRRVVPVYAHDSNKLHT